MSGDVEAIYAVAAQVAGRHVRADSVPPTGVDRAAWDELDDLGFTSVSLPDALGGGGGDLADAAAVVRATSTVAAPVAEALLLAGPLLAVAGLSWPGGVVTAGRMVQTEQETGSDTVTLSGRLDRIPWLSGADHLVLEVGGVRGVRGRAVAVLAKEEWAENVEAGHNIAGESRDSVVMAGVRCTAYAPIGDTAWQRGSFLEHGATARLLQMSEAAKQVVDLVASHVRTREQFGQPLARMQAVQQSMARLASDAATLDAGAEGALLGLADTSDAARLAIAAAKSDAATAVRTVASIAHQLHGAMGFTQEHGLGRRTTRLWSWREEYGSDLHWQQVINELRAQNPGRLWELIAGVR